MRHSDHTAEGKKTVRKKRVLGFQISQGNRLTPEINCDDSVEGIARFFSGVKSSVAPREKKREIFFFLPFAPSREVARRYLAATCTRPSRKKSGKRNIARGRKWRGVKKKQKKKNGRLREQGVSSREEIHANAHRRDSVCTFSYRFYLVGAHGPFPSAFAQLETARVRNRGKSELIVGKTPFSPRPAGVTSGGAPLSLPSPLSTRVNG